MGECCLWFSGNRPNQNRNRFFASFLTPAESNKWHSRTRAVHSAQSRVTVVCPSRTPPTSQIACGIHLHVDSAGCEPGLARFLPRRASTLKRLSGAGHNSDARVQTGLIENWAKSKGFRVEISPTDIH